MTDDDTTLNALAELRDDLAARLAATEAGGGFVHAAYARGYADGLREALRLVGALVASLAPEPPAEPEANPC